MCPAEGVQHHEYNDLLKEAYWEPEALELLTGEKWRTSGVRGKSRERATRNGKPSAHLVFSKEGLTLRSCHGKSVSSLLPLLLWGVHIWDYHGFLVPPKSQDEAENSWPWARSSRREVSPPASALCPFPSHTPGCQVVLCCGMHFSGMSTVCVTTAQLSCHINNLNTINYSNHKSLYAPHSMSSFARSHLSPS